MASKGLSFLGLFKKQGTKMKTHKTYKSSSGDQIVERDVTQFLSVYLFTIELRHTCTSGIFSE